MAARSALAPAHTGDRVLAAVSFDGSTDRLRAFRLGLKDNGYIEGENVTMEYRWTENQPGQLAELAAKLIRRRVTVIVTSGSRSQGSNHHDTDRLHRQ
jgi:putative ABC transport system substrate-binding protein